MKGLTNPTKEQKIYYSVPWGDPGQRFKAAVIAKKQNLTISEVSRQLGEYQQNGLLKNVNSEWIVV